MKTFIAFLLLVAASAFADDRILVPAPLGNLAGAHGSLWRGELWAHNRGTTAAQIETHWQYCSIIITCPPGRFTLEPGAAMRIDIDTPSMLSIAPLSSSGSASVVFGARIFDVSRQSTDWGTEIPLIHETSFTSEPIVLVNVPVTAGFRQTLRIYDLWTEGASHVRVRAFGLTENALIAERVVALTASMDFSPGPHSVSYSQNDLLQLIPELSTIERARIEVAPIDPASRIWAFISVTHNETQRVTLVTPQPLEP
jgi:hypothetical protein